MPAKKRNDKKYKPFLGRFFTIRKHKSIMASKTENGDRFSVINKQIGEIVFILDENNTRVRVTTVENNPIWISKFYLHKEIISDCYHTVDKIAEIIQKLLSISQSVKEETISNELRIISNDLSQILDKIKL